MGSGLKFLFPRTLFLAFVVLIIGEGILVLVCVALKWHSIDTFNFQNNLNFPRLFTSQKYWLHFIMFRMCWRTWGAEIIEWFTVLLQQPWEVLFWLWGYVKPQNSNHCFFLRKVWTSRPVVEEKSPINLTFGLALQQIVDLVSFVNTIETSHHTNDLSQLCHSRTKRTKYWQPMFGWVT